MTEPRLNVHCDDCDRQKATNTSLRNSLQLSVSIPRSGNGSAPRR